MNNCLNRDKECLIYNKRMKNAGQNRKCAAQISYLFYWNAICCSNFLGLTNACDPSDGDARNDNIQKPKYFRNDFRSLK